MLKPPLILTLLIDEHASRFFNTLRQQYFPPERNYLDAHLTLFHALPNKDEIIEEISASTQVQPSFTLLITEPVSIGKGVAYKLESEPLLQIHKAFQTKWQPYLTAQDKQKCWPHITVQNKVTPQEAQKTLALLKKNFTAFTVIAVGFQVWEYLNGPWKLLNTFYFKK